MILKTNGNIFCGSDKREVDIFGSGIKLTSISGKRTFF